MSSHLLFIISWILHWITVSILIRTLQYFIIYHQPTNKFYGKYDLKKQKITTSIDAKPIKMVGGRPGKSCKHLQLALVDFVDILHKTYFTFDRGWRKKNLGWRIYLFYMREKYRQWRSKNS